MKKVGLNYLINLSQEIMKQIIKCNMMS